MATVNNKTNVLDEVAKKMQRNATVSSKKQDIMEDGKVVRSLWYITIETDKGTLQINTGEKNYNEVQKMTK